VNITLALSREVAFAGAAVALKPEVTPGEGLANIVLVTSVAPPLLDDDCGVKVALATTRGLNLRSEVLVTRSA
jgi:hypothetical protein